MGTKPRLPGKWELIVVASIVAGLAAIMIPSYRIGQVRPTLCFIMVSLHSIASQLAQQAEQAGGKLADHLPETVGILDAESKQTFVIPSADPYNSRSLAGVKRSKCSVSYETGGSAGYISMSYSGNPYRYIRVSDTRAVIYSFGPDGEDDLAMIDKKKLGEDSSKDWAMRLLPYCYDPSNGTISKGDFYRYIDLNEN